MLLEDKPASARRLTISTIVSVAIHALVILLVPIGLAPPTIIYPVEYGEVTEALLTQARPPARASSPVTSPVVIRPGAKEGATTTIVKTTPEPKPEPAPKPVKPAEPRPKPAEPAPKPAAPDKAPGQPVSEPKQGPAQPKPEILTSPTGEGEMVSGSPEQGGKAAEAGSNKAGDAGVKEDKVKPGDAKPEPAGQQQGGTAAGQQHSGTPTGGQQGGAPKEGPRFNPGDFGNGEGLLASSAKPVYPKNAQNEGVEGTVEMLLTVDPEGRLVKAEIVKSAGDSRLDDIASRTAERGWSFKALGVEYRLKVMVAFGGEKVTVNFGGVTFNQ